MSDQEIVKRILRAAFAMYQRYLRQLAKKSRTTTYQNIPTVQLSHLFLIKTHKSKKVLLLPQVAN